MSIDRRWLQVAEVKGKKRRGEKRRAAAVFWHEPLFAFLFFTAFFELAACVYALVFFQSALTP